MKKDNHPASYPPLWLSLMPLIFLSACLVAILSFGGIDSIAELSSPALLAASALCLVLTRMTGSLRRRTMLAGLRKSASQVLPALPLLALIALIASTWMLSGVVPAMIHFGMNCINANLFPAIVFIMCAAVSMLSGSSWTTIATVGVAFIGIGEALGYGPGWTAGAIISGAYLGDKVSPLSDTTVVAASSCGVETLRHVRYMMGLTWPAILITLVAYLIAGLLHDGTLSAGETGHINAALAEVFNISPLVLLIPLLTGLLIAFRVNTIVTLGFSVLTGIAGIYIFQPQIMAMLPGHAGLLKSLWSGVEIAADYPTLTRLTSTSGLTGMMPTFMLIISAMLFGGVMLGSGMLDRITASFTRKLKGVTSTVSATTGSGMLLVACTSDQYLSLIVGGNMYKRHYEERQINPHLLSSTLEAGVTVTSPLLPWSSCGLTHGAVLGVGALVYAPFALFCWLSPLTTILLAKIRHRRETITCAPRYSH